MAISVPFEISREVSVPAAPKEVFELLADVPRSVSHFPKVDRLVDLGQNTFRWEMEKIGTEKYSIQTIYACRYVDDPEQLSVEWTPVRGEGNALIEGDWEIRPDDPGTTFRLFNKGELTLPFPFFVKAVVAPIVRREFEGMIERYLLNLKDSLS